MLASCCSVAQSCLTLCNPMDCSTPDFPVLHYLPEFAHTHVHWISDAIQPSHPLSLLTHSKNESAFFQIKIVFCERERSISNSNNYTSVFPQSNHCTLMCNQHVSDIHCILPTSQKILRRHLLQGKDVLIFFKFCCFCCLIKDILHWNWFTLLRVSDNEEYSDY